MTIAGRLDQFDRRILACLQEQGDIGPSELSGKVHLSASQCSRRLQRLKDEGYIENIVAVLDKSKLRLGVSSYVVVKIKDHSPAAERRVNALMSSLDEVVSCEYLAGEADYMIKVVTRDLESYASFISDKLMSSGDIESVRSSIVLKWMKRTTALPLDFC